MPNVPITIAAGDYDRTRPIKDGRVPVDGCDVAYLTMEPEELFFRAIRYEEFDVCELSLSSYIMQASKGKTAYTAIPAFLSRAFRHSGFYIRTDRGIESPADLKGRLVGMPEYQMTACVWQRGFLKDECGIAAADIHWRSGGQETPGREERAPIELPPEIDLQRIPGDRTLSGMLADGELDALMLPRAPSCFLRGAPHVGRLFPDYRAAEQDYYRKTGLHPLMHMVAVKKDLVAKYPWLPGNLYKAFRQAKDLAVADLERITALPIVLPWVGAELAASRAVLGDDIWPYGVKANAKELRTLMRYQVEQGLTDRAQDLEDLFAATTFATAVV